MSVLEMVKEKNKLLIKPMVESCHKFNIVIIQKTKKSEGFPKPSFVVETKPFDIETLMKRLKYQKVVKEKHQVEPEQEEEREQEQIFIKKVKKLGKKQTLTTEGEKPSRKKREPKEKVKSTIPANLMSLIGDTQLVTRLPEKQQVAQYKLSAYYMNNREKFVNSINSLFRPYREEILEEDEQISCDDIGKNAKSFTLLTNQRLVRDYLNLHTPYRGLLLYHSLGSGKTFTSIAIAEGMKDRKQVIVMTPASLRDNYVEQLKTLGDPIYKINQFWEWISLEENPETLETLSAVLNLPTEYIRKKKGAWLMNSSKESNYSTLDGNEQRALNEQINTMIESKYLFINYNGLRKDNLTRLTNNYEKNIFDDAVVIIDEAHNFISRIVNKFSKRGKVSKKITNDDPLSVILYDMLMDAQGARVVLLTGTPIINYPNEIAILYNILRGYIKTWEITLDDDIQKKISKEYLAELFKREKLLDYLDYSQSSRKITITRNPLGFLNAQDKRKNDYIGVTNEDKTNPEVGYISDADFQKNILRILKNDDMKVSSLSAVKVHKYKALPDTLDEFMAQFITSNSEDAIVVKNMDLFKKRIIGLTSYFRSAQESLLPKYERATDFHVVKIPMSDYQFPIYEAARSTERKQESKKKAPKVDKNGIYQETSSTYRIFSRLYCNFVAPKPPGRPLPNQEEDVDIQLDKAMDKEMDEPEDREDRDDLEEQLEVDEEGLIAKLGDKTYDSRMKNALAYLKEHSSEFFTPEALEMYSPKYLKMLENILDPEHIGLHLVYSQFRTFEGLGVFTMVLKENGFGQFKIKKDLTGIWDIDMDEEDMGKPTFALYTGTESKEEKEIIRKIYNGEWDNLSLSLSNKLREIARNNNRGEIIKVLMITASGSEGINLRNTRYVHIMEPYWNPARIEQVVGRASRICSHNDLPESLKTVEVFLYLMTFSKEQLEKASIELKKKDLSKRKYKIRPDKTETKKIPFTSDEALFEICNIKEEINNHLTLSIKEASIDCATYQRKGSKEKLQCLQFGQPKSTAFSYQPSLSKDQPDTLSKINKTSLEWTGVERIIMGKPYIYRNMGEKRGYLYDFESYQQALENPGMEPTFIGVITEKPNGDFVIE